MTQFMLFFRHEYNPSFQPSPEQMQDSIKNWQDWISGIAAQGKFVSTNRIGFQGRTLKPNNVVTEGPYAEVKETIGGYIIVKAENIDDAFALAHGCPILNMGGNVEVRDIMEIAA